MSRLSSLSSSDTTSTSRSNSSSASSAPSLNRSNSGGGLSVADLLQSDPSEQQRQRQSQPQPQPPPQQPMVRAEIQSPFTHTTGKVPIPRQRNAAVSKHSRRVPRACESCRLRKTKCSGDSPVCKLCRDTNTPCIYPLAIREKTNRTITHLSRRLRECEDILREVEGLVPKPVAERIHALLEKDSDLNLNDTPLVEEHVQEDAPRPHLRARSLASRVGSLEVVETVNQNTSMSDDASHQGFQYRHGSTTVQQNPVTQAFIKYARPSHQLERSASG